MEFLIMSLLSYYSVILNKYLIMNILINRKSEMINHISKIVIRKFLKM